MSDIENAEGPAFQIAKGNPTPEEVAAVATVLSAVAASQSDRRPHAPTVGTVAGGWKSYWRVVRQPLLTGQEAWRTTFRA